jgi:hypothetical protein
LVALGKSSKKPCLRLQGKKSDSRFTFISNPSSSELRADILKSRASAFQPKLYMRRMPKLCTNPSRLLEAFKNIILTFPFLGPLETPDLIYGIGHVGLKNPLVVF